MFITYIILLVSAVLTLYPFLAAKRDSLVDPVKIEVNTLWHRIGFIIRVSLVSSIFLFSPLERKPTYLILYGIYFWLVFDAMYNIFTNKPILYPGSTAASDKFFSYYKIYIKLTLLIACITYLIYHG